MQTARTLFEQGNYNEAKKQIDSIKILYPKAFEVRRAGIGLMQEIELKEQTRTLAYLDSTLQVKQQEVDAVRGAYTFEKDTAYQRVGNYFHPSQVVERNLHRSFLRFQVDEAGVMSMTSIYCGTAGIRHTAVKVTAPDGSFAETPTSGDRYDTTDLGEKIEKVDYKMGQDGNVIGFLYLNRNHNIRVTFVGTRPYSTVMSATDRQAVAAIYELAKLLSSVTEIKKDMEETQVRIKFIQERMQAPSAQ